MLAGDSLVIWDKEKIQYGGEWMAGLGLGKEVRYFLDMNGNIVKSCPSPNNKNVFLYYTVDGRKLEAYNLFIETLTRINALVIWDKESI